MSSMIHPSAVIHEGAELGVDVEIGPFCEVGPKVRLGDRVHLYGRSSVIGTTELGDECQVLPGAVLGGKAQSLGSEDDPENRLIVGSRCVFRESVTANVGTHAGGGITRIGADGYFMAYSHVGHDCQIGEKCVIANNVAFGGHTHVGEQVWVGGLAVVHQNSHIGDHAFVAGGAIVVGDVVPYAMVAGNRASLTGINANGLKRRGFTRADMTNIRATFKAVFEGDGAFAERMEAARAAVKPGTPGAEIIAFIDRPSRTRPLCFPGRV